MTPLGGHLNRIIVFWAAAITAALMAADPAAASYGARSAPLLWEQQTWDSDTGAQSAAVLRQSLTLLSCDNVTGDQLCRSVRSA